jgi:hypothetical protein
MAGAPSGFYAATLRFVAAKLEGGDDARIMAMRGVLTGVADALEAGGALVVAPGDLEVASRAFAGVAAFLQKRILPETVAHGHAERQVRWSVDASMAVVNTLLQAATGRAGEGPVTIHLPPPPQ